MTEDATTEVVSWLQLERHGLGELSSAEAERVAAALAEDPEGARIVERIATDERRLPPLPEVQPERDRRAGLWTGAVNWWRSVGRRWRLASGMLAVSAAAVVLIGPRLVGERPAGRGGDGIEASSGARAPGPRIATKGGDVAIGLIRERAGALSYEPGDYAPGDRFKVVITCPVQTPLFGDVVVYQGEDAEFPLPANSPLPCGNRVALSGAFTLTGDAPAEVCLVFDRQPAPDRERLRDRRAVLQGRARGEVGPDLVCSVLRAGSL